MKNIGYRDLYDVFIKFQDIVRLCITPLTRKITLHPPKLYLILHLTPLNYTLFYTCPPKLWEYTLNHLNYYLCNTYALHYENTHFPKQSPMRWGAKYYTSNSLRG